MWVLGPNLGPPQEQEVFLITEPSFQPITQKKATKPLAAVGGHMSADVHIRVHGKRGRPVSGPPSERGGRLFLSSKHQLPLAPQPRVEEEQGPRAPFSRLVLNRYRSTFIVPSSLCPQAAGKHSSTLTSWEIKILKVSRLLIRFFLYAWPGSVTKICSLKDVVTKQQRRTGLGFQGR